MQSGIRLKRSVSFCNLLWVISLLCVRPPLAGPSVSLIQCWQCSGLISGNTRGINSDTRQGDARQPSSGIRAGCRLQLQMKVSFAKISEIDVELGRHAKVIMDDVRVG